MSFRSHLNSSEIEAILVHTPEEYLEMICVDAPPVIPEPSAAEKLTTTAQHVLEDVVGEVVAEQLAEDVEQFIGSLDQATVLRLDEELDISLQQASALQEAARRPVPDFIDDFFQTRLPTGWQVMQAHVQDNWFQLQLHKEFTDLMGYQVNNVQPNPLRLDLNVSPELWRLALHFFIRSIIQTDDETQTSIDTHQSSSTILIDRRPIGGGDPAGQPAAGEPPHTIWERQALPQQGAYAQSAQSNAKTCRDDSTKTRRFFNCFSRLFSDLIDIFFPV